MAYAFPAAPLVAAPSFPNSIAWSEENLIAIASGHLVTILNPALLTGPRGLITLPKSEPYQIGVVKREELLSDFLLPISLSRDCQPCVRSISWSPIGMAPNSGCLLAVCGTDGHVKLYHAPFYSFCSQWIEILDITDSLYNYLSSYNPGKLEFPSSEFLKETGMDHNHNVAVENSQSNEEHKRRRVDTCSLVKCNIVSDALLEQIQDDHSTSKEIDTSSILPLKVEEEGLLKKLKNRSSKPNEKVPPKSASLKARGKSANRLPENSSLPLIAADQYASCSAMLASLVVTWSPVIKLSSLSCPLLESSPSNVFSLLAVGSKCGKISVWRFHAPVCYSLEPNGVPASAVLTGVLQAHSSWITTMSFALLSDSLNPHIVLASGSSDGSVKIWMENGEKLLKSSEASGTTFFLLKEIENLNAVPVSVLSLITLAPSLHKLALAVGRGSGAIEVWMGDISRKKFDKIGSYDAHDQVVTGLAWAFTGSSLYSCSQDNFVRSWNLHETALHEIPIPSFAPDSKGFGDLPDLFISCVGVAVSPGNLVLAVVRNFDVDQLKPMYEARAQKAAVEFIWIGGQEVDIFSSNFSEFNDEALPVFTEKKLAHWESNILWALKQHENVDKPLVVWDIIAALLAFKRTAPEFVGHVLVRWLAMSFVGSWLGLPVEELMQLVAKTLSKVGTRQLHLFNVMCRRVVLADLETDDVNGKLRNLRESFDGEDNQLALWMQLLFGSEKELRERLIGFCFSAIVGLASEPSTLASEQGYWYPVGMAQMQQWVSQNYESLHKQVKALAADFKTHESSREQQIEHNLEEKCSYCQAPVPFDSPEVAFCEGSKVNNGATESHKLERCAVTMQVCPTSPLWFCKCCHRRTSKLAPSTLFAMTRNCVDSMPPPTPPPLKPVPVPFCLFCGILLQRLQPDILLSPSPV